MFGLMRARTCAKHTEPWREWRNHYCGTCKTIGARYGQAARMALNHDTVFLAELLTALSSSFEQSAAYRSFNCMSQPKTDAEMPAVLRYAAAATLVLAEFKVLDHIEDTGRRRWRALGLVFSGAFQKARRDLLALGFPVARLQEVLHQQSAKERGGRSFAEFSAPTAEATSMFFAHGATVVGFAGDLSQLGYKFGELAYLLDAFEDFEKDLASGAFNAIRAAGGATKREVLPKLQALSEQIREELERHLKPDAAAAFASRLKANLDTKLGLHLCAPKVRGGRPSRKLRWTRAVEFAKGISSGSPRWRAGATVLAVAVVAYLVPSHSRAASTPSECLSLGFNLMALGSMFAMASAGSLPPVDPSVNLGGKAAKAGKGSCCGSCDCDDSVNCGPCDGCCCACESAECCSGCGDCCSGCGDCSCDC